MLVAAVTDVGLHRKRNEDQYWIDAKHGIFAVCDGMGGHRGGDVASKLTVETLQQNLVFTDYEQVVPALLASVEKANQVVHQMGQSDPELYDMGTTVTVTVMGSQEMTVAHVGDSCLYLFRSGELSKITRDHTLAESLRQQGLTKPSDKAVNQYKHVLTRAIGVDPKVDIDLIQHEIKPGDWILLCTDGLTDMVEEREIAGQLSIAKDPQVAARALVDMALKNGGFDNITVVLISM